MNQQVPKSIEPILDDYISRVNQQLPGLINAFYLEGSTALGGFNELFSDIDFVTILQRKMIPTEIEILRNIHMGIEKSQPQWKMSGSYLQSDYLGYLNNKAEPNLYYHDSILKQNGHFKWNSVEGWILKNHGIAIVGPEPQALPIAIDWELIIKEMRGNLNSYWAKWTTQPDRVMVMFLDWGIQWAVLGVLRQYYSFRENSITTKTKAGEYALACLPAKWHRPIQAAINIREGKKVPAYPFRMLRTIEAVQFLKFIIQTCNDGFI